MYENTRAAGFGAEVKRRILIGTYVLSAGYYDAYYLKAQKVRTLIKPRFRRGFREGRCDPDARPRPRPPSASARRRGDPVEMYLNDIFTVTVNMAGLPGISRAGRALDARACRSGLQLIGRPFDEGTLFSLGRRDRGGGGRLPRPDASGGTRATPLPSPRAEEGEAGAIRRALEEASR